MSIARAVPGLATALLVAAPVNAQTDAQTETEVPFNWGYASAFGRGLYRLDDGTDAQIYRLEIKPPLQKRDAEEGLTTRLVLPLTFGLQQSLALSHNTVEEYAFMPGVELEMKPGERFMLRATVQAGAGKQKGADQPSAKLASLGVRSRLKFTNAPGRPAFIAGVRWAGVDPDTGERSSLLRVTTGLEFDIAAGGWQVHGHQMRLLPHVLADRYYRPHGFLALGTPPGPDEPDVMTHEWQVGLAAGRDVPFRIWFLRFNALGVAYRFSEFSPGIRFYLNSVF